MKMGLVSVSTLFYGYDWLDTRSRRVAFGDANRTIWFNFKLADDFYYALIGMMYV